MSTIAVGKSCAKFVHTTPICGNCQHEKRERDETRNRTERSCRKHGWFVLMSSSCNDHEYKQSGARHATT